jgi:hypothetical protein
MIFYYNLRNSHQLRTIKNRNCARTLTGCAVQCLSLRTDSSEQSVNCVEPVALNLIGSLCCLICRSLSELAR